MPTPDDTKPSASSDTIREGNSSAEQVVDGRIYRLGGFVPLDGRLSWSAKRPGRIQPISGYVVQNDDRAYVLDTGVAAHRATVIQQFSGLLKKDQPVTAFLTRADYQCLGNLEALNDQHPLEELAFDIRSPFSAFDDVKRNLQNVRETLLTPGFGGYKPLAASDDLVVFPAMIRILGTNWVYSKSQRTLFTSDWFCHTDLAADAQSSILTDSAMDETTYESAIEHVQCKYYWLSQANTDPLRVWLKKIFEDLDVQIIAPTVGCILSDQKLVEKHYELAMEMLLKLGRKNG